jgi:hypothetical protein
MSRSKLGGDPDAILVREESPEHLSGADAAQLRRGSGAAAPAAARLDKRTHLDEAKYRVILRYFGPGLAEAGYSFISARPFKNAARGKSERAQEHRDRAVRRSRSRLRHLILATKSDHLLTLTYRANVVDFDAACRDLAKFVRLVKQRKPHWTYIAVAERQKRGAWHWHLAVQGRQDVGLLRATWLRVAGDGNIDVAAAKSKHRNRSLALVRYLSKYLAKGFAEDHELNARRFRASHGIRVPATVLTLPLGHRGKPLVFAVEEVMKAAGRVGFWWEAKDRTAGWVNSWE